MSGPEYEHRWIVYMQGAPEGAFLPIRTETFEDEDDARSAYQHAIGLGKDVVTLTHETWTLTDTEAVEDYRREEP